MFQQLSINVFDGKLLLQITIIIIKGFKTYFIQCVFSYLWKVPFTESNAWQ